MPLWDPYIVLYFIVAPSVFLERSYLCSCIVKTTPHNHIFINMTAHTAAFVSTISPIYIQPQSGSWFEYPELRKCCGQQYWSGVYSCIFANRSYDYKRDFPSAATRCTNEFLFKPTTALSTPMRLWNIIFAKKGDRFVYEPVSYELWYSWKSRIYYYIFLTQFLFH